MNEYIKISERLFADDGGELLRYSLAYPQLSQNGDGIKKINEFYDELAANCKAFCIGELFSFCEKKRHEDTDYKTYLYRLACAVSFEDAECVSIVISASLKRIGVSGYMGEYSSAQIFSKSDGMLLSPVCVIKKYMPEIRSPRKYLRRGGFSDLCITQSGITALRDGKWIALETNE